MARLRRRAQLIDSSTWRFELEQSATRIGIRDRVQLKVSDQVDGPVQVGLLRSEIILPRTIADRQETEHAAILVHELCHITRRDYLFNVIGQLAQVLYWFHPLVWYAMARLRSTGEQACDDASIALLGRHDSYAESLLNISALLRIRSPAVAVCMARRGKVAARIDRISDLGGQVTQTGRLAGASLFVGTLCMAGLMTSLVPASHGATGDGYPASLTLEMSEQMATLLAVRAASLSKRLDRIGEDIARHTEGSLRERYRLSMADLESQRLELAGWSDSYLPTRDWSSVDWETRSLASHQYGSFARDAFNKRFISLGLYLADRAFEANPLSGHTYAIKWLMLLPRYAVDGRLKADAIERIILRDLEPVERLQQTDGMAFFNDASERVVSVDAQGLPRIKDGLRSYAYRSLYQWTEKQAYFDSIIAISGRKDVGGQDPNQLFSLAQLVKDPVASVDYLRRYIEGTPAAGHGGLVLARAHQQALTLAAEHPGVLEDDVAERLFTNWRAMLDQEPLRQMATEQAEFSL